MLRLTCRPDELFETVADYFREDGGAWAARTIIVPMTGDVDRWRSRLAEQCPELAFDMKVATLSGYASELWALFGDGRRFATHLAERLVMARVLGSLEGSGLGRDASTVELLCGAAEIGLGMPRFDKTLSLYESGEQKGTDAVWRALSAYRGALTELGLVTYGQALHALSRGWEGLHMAGMKPPVLAGFDYLLPSEIDFVSSIGASAFLPVGDNAPAFARVAALARELGCTEAEGPAGMQGRRAVEGELELVSRHLFKAGSPVTPTGAVRFAIGAGEHAETPLLEKTIAGLVKDGIAPEDIYVVDDALPSSLDLQERLARRGIASCGRMSLRLDASELGRAFRWVVEGASVRSLSDFALSPFSGLGRRDARLLDERWRSRRSTTVESCMDDLVRVGGAAAAIVEASRRGDYGKVAQAMAATYLRRPADGLHAALVQAASVKIVELYDACEAVDGDRDSCLGLMELVRVSARYRVGAPAGGAVEFGPLHGLAARPCRAAVIAGFTSSAFPVSKDGDQLVMLLQGAGVDVHDSYLDMMRYRFYRAVSAPSDVLVIERRLADADGREANPSALLEELVDCYRADPSSFDDLDRATALPNAMLGEGPACTRLVTIEGEDSLPDISPAPSWPTGSHAARGARILRAEDGDKAMRRAAALLALGAADDPRALSPTYAELYMTCPYRWFVERKVSPEGLDSKLDARALGTLTHEVLKRYYLDLSEGAGPRRIGNEDIQGLTEKVASLARACISDLVKEDPASPFAIVSELDRRLVKARLRSVRNLLADDRRFLQGFVPMHFERGFGDDEPFEYAGRPLHGTIDRIDVDAKGRAVIIDYKGALGNSFCFAPGEDGTLPQPEKLQVLMYATAARRLWGLDVVGAVYRSYSARESVCGAYNDAVIGPAQLFGYEEGGMASWMFEDLLQETERRVERAYEGMAAGDIAPNPASEAACRYCPACNCLRKVG